MSPWNRRHIYLFFRDSKFEIPFFLSPPTGSLMRRDEMQRRFLWPTNDDWGQRGQFSEPASQRCYRAFNSIINVNMHGCNNIFWLLLAPPNDALRRGAYRDFHTHPTHPSTYSVQAFNPVYIQKHFGVGTTNSNWGIKTQVPMTASSRGMISTVDNNNGKQWTTMDNNGQQWITMHLWCRFFTIIE